MTSIFEKIVAGEIPSYKVYEDDVVFAFLDINPVCVGHTLLIPKKCYETVEEMPTDTSEAIGRVLPKLAKAVRIAVGAKGYNILSNNGKEAGQEVPHVHFHIIPRSEGGLKALLGWKTSKLEKEDAVKIVEEVSANMK